VLIATIGSIIQSVAVIVATVVAVRGINAWRREHVGRKRIDTAEEILELFYQARDHFAHIRSIGAHLGEGSTRKPEPNESAEDKELLDRAFVTIERYRRHSDDFAKLRRLRYRALAYWGTRAAAPFDAMEEVIGRILTAAQAVTYYWKRQGSGHYPEGFELHLKQKRAYEADIWERPTDDPIKPIVERMVKQVEELCRPVIEVQSRERQRGVALMNTPNDQQLDRLQRDKEVRSSILSEFFSRLMWLDAAAIAAIVAFLAEHETLKPATLFASRIAAVAFAASLVVVILVPLKRFEASFDRNRRDFVSWTMHLLAAGFAIGGVIATVAGVWFGFDCGFPPKAD
jgi:hypothetical protein